MKKRQKVVTIISSSFLVVGLAFFSAAYFTLLHRYKGSDVINEWSKNDQFDISKIKTVKKEKNKDFVVLNLADVQMCDLEDLFNKEIIHKEIDYLVATYKPNLITLTGDQTWSNENLICLKSLISWLEGYKIPFAPIFGNHDYGNDGDYAVASQKYCCDLYEKASYCLFDRGPTNISSLGNYVINIEEDDKIVSTLYMLDYGYNKEINSQQIERFKWNAEGIKNYNNNNYTNGICFTHKPLYGHLGFDPGIINSNIKNDFEKTVIKRGISDFICGHYHEYNRIKQYDSARYTFATKTGELGGFLETESIYLNGATTIEINEHETKIVQNLVNNKDYRIKK